MITAAALLVTALVFFAAGRYRHEWRVRAAEKWASDRAAAVKALTVEREKLRDELLAARALNASLAAKLMEAYKPT